MTRTIKASEVKPGMEVEFTTRMKIRLNILRIGPQQEMRDDSGHVARVDADAPVTVLSEPAPAQPEEPTEFGARVGVRDGRFVRLHDEGVRAHVWHEEGTGCRWTWEDLFEMGPVTVIEADPSWTVPADTPEVPERVDEWDTWEDVPEGVVVTTPGLFCHYRKNQGVVEFSDPDNDPDWTEPNIRSMPRRYAPWTRVTDA